MSSPLPENSSQLRWMLGIRLGLAATVVALLAGGVAYSVETYRAEQAALEQATRSAQHFATPAMQMIVSAGRLDGHDELERLLDKSRFVGLQVFDRDGSSVYENWGNSTVSLIDVLRAQTLTRPGGDRIHRTWIEVGSEHLIHVVVPISAGDDRLVGYVRTVSRLDAESVQAQRNQVRTGVLTAIGAVVATALVLYPLMLAMLRRSTDLSRSLLDSNLSLIRSLGNAVAKKDSGTDAHNYRVTLYAIGLAEALKVSAEDISHLVAGAFLHDVGKIGIPDSILLKGGSLTPAELQVMQTHPVLGTEIVTGNPWLQEAAVIIQHHHERLDGKGYPDGLRGEEIPLIARIFAVVDVFDALTSERSYKSPMGFDEAMQIILRESGSHFDSSIVAAFRDIAPALYATITRADPNELQRRLNEALLRYFKLGVLPSVA
ncbi:MULTISPECIES: HD-GYP domain-containing protein [Betaproteobacteria]|uniref:HD-GYP domain-containing protein n=1 Tax=Betaproteobacteria TaxID=28216 RepID=UPI002FDF3497